MNHCNKRAKDHIKSLPIEQRFVRLQEIFEESFVEQLDIPPCLYFYPSLSGEGGGNKGKKAKRSYIHRVFTMCLDLIVQKMIEEVRLYKAPTTPSPCYLYFGKKKDEDCERLFTQKTGGVYADCNPIELDFKLYNLYFVYRHGRRVKSFPVKIPYNSYKRLLYKLKTGIRYYDHFVYNKVDINTITTKDFNEEMFYLHPGLERKIFYEIMEYGFRKIKNIKNRGHKIKIVNLRHGIKYVL